MDAKQDGKMAPLTCTTANISFVKAGLKKSTIYLYSAPAIECSDKI
jgi:hypothetical protein